MLYGSLLFVCEAKLTFFCFQVHIQQIGQRELRRAPAITQRLAAIRKKEKELEEHYNVKAHL